MLTSVLLSVAAAFTPGQSPIEADLESALEQVEEQCRVLLKLKDIDLKKVGKVLRKEAKKAKTDQDEMVLLQHLVAALQDGHARVERSEALKELRWPEDESWFDSSRERGDSGLALCQVGKKIYVKAVAGAAEDVGIEAGSEVLKIDDSKPLDWLEERIATNRKIFSWSTDTQAFFWATHWGLAGRDNERMKLELKGPDRKKKKRTISYGDSSVRMAGPAVWPANLETTKDLAYGLLPEGWGYVRLRRCKDDLPEQMDQVLETIGAAPGIILDFRGNGGGGFDHDALLGRFVPKGTSLQFAKTIPSAGPAPYGGPVVVIVDGTVVSAGETASGMFKEEGRGYMIGESTTAGMSASKATLELPSGKFSLYVSVRSNKSRWQNGRGIEGIGVEPHEIVEFDPEDLAAGVDTQIRVAGERLAKMPKGKVPYKPIGE